MKIILLQIVYWSALTELQSDRREYGDQYLDEPLRKHERVLVSVPDLVRPAPSGLPGDFIVVHLLISPFGRGIRMVVLVEVFVDRPVAVLGLACGIFKFLVVINFILITFVVFFILQFAFPAERGR